jgi:hypothetical protein
MNHETIHRNSLDRKQREVFDWLVFEVAGMREETLVMHHGVNYTREKTLISRCFSD